MPIRKTERRLRGSVVRLGEGADHIISQLEIQLLVEGDSATTTNAVGSEQIFIRPPGQINGIEWL